MAPASPNGVAVHLAGRMTDLVFGFLRPATAALAASGVKQVIVLIDAPEYRHLLPQFDSAVQLVLSPDEGSAWRRWQRLAQVFRGATERDDLRAVHLHGFVPLLVCACARCRCTTRRTAPRPWGRCVSSRGRRCGPRARHSCPRPNAPSPACRPRRAA